MGSTSELSAIAGRGGSRAKLAEKRGETPNDLTLGSKQQLECEAIEQLLRSHGLGQGPEGLGKLMNLLNAQAPASLQAIGDGRV